MKSKLVGLREAWVEEEKEREARQSQRLDTFAKVRFCFVPLSAQNNALLHFCPGECHAAGKAGEGDGRVEGEHLGRGGGGQAGRTQMHQAEARFLV